MNRVKYILRATLLFLFVLQLIYIYRADNSLKEIVKFKYEAFRKANDDSLYNQQKFDSLIKKTKEFNKEVIAKSPHLTKDMGNLITIVVLLIVTEISFFFAKRKN